MSIGASSTEGGTATRREAPPELPSEARDLGDGGTGPHRPRRPVRPRGFLRRGTFGNTRARVLLLVVGLLLLAGVVEVFTLGALSTRSLERRVQADLEQELEELFILLEYGVDPVTGGPFERVDRFFDVFLERNVPSNQEAFLTFVGGRDHEADLSRFPVDDELPLQTVAAWRRSSASTSGPATTVGEVVIDGADAQYRTARVVIGDGIGVFAVVLFPRAELTEIRSLQSHIAVETLGATVLFLSLAWVLIRRVLRPIQQLTETASSISSFDRNGRLEPTGPNEAVEIAETLNDMLDRLQTAYDSQLEFLHAAGHELRTPLTVAVGHLDLVHQGSAPADVTLPLVLTELQRMGRMVQELESLAASSRPDFLVRGPVDVSELTTELLLKVAPLGDRQWRLDGVTMVTVVADPHRLTQAVLNLAQNAVAHTDDAGTISIGSAATEEEVTLWVRDDGVGIAAEDQGRIFERFVRGAGAVDRYRGAGLGLAVVRGIAEAHGGRVEVTSTVGAGATFTIHLPRTEVTA